MAMSAGAPEYSAANETMQLDGHQTVPAEKWNELVASGCFNVGSASTQADADGKTPPAPIGGSYTDWEYLGQGRFNAELGLVEPCDVDVWYCTTDPSGNGMGVDAYQIDGVYTKGIRFVSMPYIDYTKIGSTDTGLTKDGKNIMMDELSNYYNVGISSSLQSIERGILEIGALYYVDDPEVVDNVVAYGKETVKLAGEFYDYRVNLEIAGECRDGARLKVNTSFYDATNVKVKCYPGALNYRQLLVNSNAQHNDATIEALTESGSQYFPLDADGTYTVIVTYNKGEEMEYQSATYEYDSQWEDYGTAEFTEDYLASYYDNFPVATATGIKVQQHKVNKGHFRLVNPYSTTDTWVKIYPRLQYAEPEVNSFLVINAEKPEQVYVYINPVDITYDDGVRMVCGSAAHYNLINDRTEEQITERGYWGKIETADGVSTITFPERTLMMRPVNSESPLFANMNGAFKVVMKATGAGVDDITVTPDDVTAVAAYTLSGMSVDIDAAPAGIYVVKYSDGSARKIVK